MQGKVKETINGQDPYSLYISEKKVFPRSVSISWVEFLTKGLSCQKSVQEIAKS